MNKYKVEIDDEKTIRWYKWDTDKLHREDRPAVEYSNGDKFWYLNGKLHRKDGPAIEWSNGNKFWYLNGRCHRKNGPAIEYANGNKSWYLEGKRHRVDGPAIEWADGFKEWWLNNKQLSKQEWKKQVSFDCFDRVVEIDGVEYVLKKV